jgi:glycosyltransferase involved in cell wall biosynthesis
LKILLCTEFFYPSVGGAQEVVKQIATRLALQGHDVTVATSYLEDRICKNFQGIKIVDFKISGNIARGISGELAQYQAYVKSEKFELIFIYAAQQWTFDALWGVLDQINSKKIFVPCGYSGLYDPAYATYFSELPNVLRKFDSLIYHSKTYRDYTYGLEHHLTQCYIVPNGADNEEFNRKPPVRIRNQFNISDKDHLFLTVGSLNGAKGHLELLKVITRIGASSPITMLLNGNRMTSASFVGWKDFLCRLTRRIKNDSVMRLFKNFVILILKRVGIRKDYFSSMNELIKKINSGHFGRNKRVIIANLSRDDLISAYFESDVFLFASNIEYSPLVLYEACAAGLPYITCPVGNSEEIIEWTRGGVLCAAQTDELGNVHINIDDMVNHIETYLHNPDEFQQLGQSGRSAWKRRFNWDTLVNEYLEIFQKILNEPINR